MMSYKSSFFLHFVYPPGKPRIPHLLRCRGLAADYGFPGKAWLRFWTPWIWGILNFRSIRVKGIATVQLSDGTICEAEIHWFEAHGLGRKDFKIKRVIQ
jgi:hypothetical protein